MINLNELTPHHPAFHNIVASHLPHYFAGGPQASKPFGKWLSPCAEPPNHSENDFRRARRNTNFIYL